MESGRDVRINQPAGCGEEQRAACSPSVPCCGRTRGCPGLRRFWLPAVRSSRQRAVQCNLVVDSMEMCTNGITVPDTDTGCVRMDKDFPDGIVFAKWSSGFREKIFFKPGCRLFRTVLQFCYCCSSCRPISVRFTAMNPLLPVL